MNHRIEYDSTNFEYAPSNWNFVLDTNPSDKASFATSNYVQESHMVQGFYDTRTIQVQNAVPYYLSFKTEKLTLSVIVITSTIQSCASLILAS